MKTRMNKGAAVLAALLLLLSAGCQATVEQDEAGKAPTIGYAMEGVSDMVTNEEELARAVDEMVEESEKYSIALAYKPVAFSTDGINFTCTLGNSEENTDDMYIQLFGDHARQDELFLSGLLRPGTAFENITLNHALNPGTHEVYCTFTLVHTDEDGTQSITNEMTVTVEFVVAND